MPHDDTDLILKIGELSGALTAHIRQYDTDRADRMSDRENADTYRKEVRHELRNLTMGMSALPAVVSRIEKVEKTVAVLGAVAYSDAEAITRDFEFVRRVRAAFDTMKEQGVKTATNWVLLGLLGAAAIFFKDSLLGWFGK